MAGEMENSKFDEVFLGIIQNCGKIEPFLDSVFSFLSRRTDFFLMMHKKDDKLGFPPGIAEKMLIKIFRKYQERVLQKDPIYMRWKAGGEKDNSEMWQDVAPKVEEIVDHEEIVKTGDDKSEQVDRLEEKKQCTPKEKSGDSAKSAENPTNGTQEKSQPGKTESNADNDCFNGGKTDAYSWSQTISDVDVKVPIPPFVRKSKDLSIDIQSHNIAISLKNDPPADSALKSKLILSGTLKEKIKCADSLWSLVPGKHIEVNLEKFEHKWWDCVFEGDPEIDRTQIDTTQHVHDFDEQTQGDIRKVMYDQQQKMMGKPTSDEQKTHSMLEKAWDAEGSPFKGTPFDPSRVNLST